MDSQLDSGSPCIVDLKEGPHLKIALIFTHRFSLKGIAYATNNGTSHVENLYLFILSSLCNYQLYDSDCFLALMHRPAKIYNYNKSINLYSPCTLTDIAAYPV